MKYKCTHACQVLGLIRHRGEYVELSDEVYKEHAHSFAQIDGPTEEDEGMERPDDDPSLLTRAQLKAKLKEMGVPFRVRDSYASLKESYDKAMETNITTEL